MADYSISTLITADSSDFDKNVKKAGKSLNGFSSNIKSVTKLLGGLFAITSITALAKSIKDVSEEFSKATANIAKGTGATGKALQNLSKSVNNAMRLGVGRSASEVGSMIADLNTRFGVTDKTLERMVDRFDMFASVTDTDVKTSINSVADLMAKWNVSLEDSDKLLDQLTVASQMGGASVTELSAGLKTGQAILSQFGMSLTESTAFLASLSKNGVSTGVALTGLRTALANFSADGKEASSAFKEVSDKIKNAKTQTEALQIATETFGARSGAEMVKVLQSSSASTEEFAEALRNAGGALAETDRASRTSQDALDDLKATIQATFFSSGADTGLRDMIDSIAEAFRNINFDELKEQFSSIGLFLQGVWEQFKELFNNIKEAIDISGTNFGSWKEVIYNHLNAVYRVLQDWVGGFSALLKGDFSLAWDYVKLAVMRTADYMIDILSKLANSMPELINKIIDGLNAGINKLNEGLALIGKDPIDLIGHIDHVDLSDALGLDKSIKELEKKIEQATGKVADKTLKDLKKVSSNVKSTTKEITSEIGDIGESTTTTTEEITDDWDNLADKIFTDCQTKIKDSINNTLASGLKEIGQSLIDGSNGWEQFGQTALQALSDTLYAIGQQLMAQATALLITKQYADAMVAFAGATTTIMASGIVAGMINMAKSLDSSVSSLKAFRKELQEVLDSIKDTTSLFIGVSTIKTSINTLTSELQANEVAMENWYSSFIGKYSDLVQKWGSLTWVVEDGEFKYINRTFENILSSSESTINKIIQLISPANIYKIFEEGKLIGGTGTSKVNELLRSGIMNEWNDLSETWADLTYKLRLLYEALYNSVNEYNEKLLDSVDSSRSVISNYEQMFNATNAVTEALKLYGETGEKVYNTLAKVYEKYAEVLYNVQLSSLESVRQGAYEDLLNAGTSIGETLVNSIVDGASKSDFMEDMKDYIREQMIALVIYTESFNKKMAEVGAELASAMATGSGLDEVASELEALWKEASKGAEEVEELMSEIFGNITESALDAIDTVKDSLSDIGSELADSLVSGLTDGLSQSDFLQNMYEWIRKLIIQTVVYTESMKSEIEAIGKAISDGLANGFTEDSLHEIRRDLSYIFYSANKQMEGIDDVLSGVFSGYATGTENASKGLHLVGEAGPELVAFNGGEKVYNAEETSRMLNGGNNFNVTFNNTQDTTAFAMVQQLRQYNREMAINGIF